LYGVLNTAAPRLSANVRNHHIIDGIES
jgi:hypothetical protein